MTTRTDTTTSQNRLLRQSPLHRWCALRLINPQNDIQDRLRSEDRCPPRAAYISTSSAVSAPVRKRSVAGDSWKSSSYLSLQPSLASVAGWPTSFPFSSTRATWVGGRPPARELLMESAACFSSSGPLLPRYRSTRRKSGDPSA